MTARKDPLQPVDDVADRLRNFQKNLMTARDNPLLPRSGCLFEVLDFCKMGARILGVICGLALIIGLIGVQIKQSAIRSLIVELNQHDSARAANELGLYGKDAEQAIPSLVRALKSKDEETSFEAALALARIAPDRPEVEGVRKRDRVRKREEAGQVRGSGNGTGVRKREETGQVRYCGRKRDRSDIAKLGDSPACPYCQ